MAASIVVREFNRQEFFNVNQDSFATVATVITSTWGPGIFELREGEEDNNNWTLITAGEGSVENFRRTYGDPVTTIPGFEKSYGMALALLAAGYDVLVCRLAVGLREQYGMTDYGSGTQPICVAKYPGSFGRRLKVVVKKVGKFNQGSTFDNNSFYRVQVLLDNSIVESWDLQPYDLQQIPNRPKLTASDISKMSNYIDLMQPISSTGLILDSTTFGSYSFGNDTGARWTSSAPPGSSWSFLPDPLNPKVGNVDYDFRIHEIVYIVADLDGNEQQITYSLQHQLIRKAVVSSTFSDSQMSQQTSVLINVRNREVASSPYTQELSAVDGTRAQHNRQTVLTMMTGILPEFPLLIKNERVPGAYSMLADYFRYGPHYVISPVASDLQVSEEPEMHQLHRVMWYGAAIGRGARAIIDYPPQMRAMDAARFSEACSTGVADIRFMSNLPEDIHWLDGYPESFGSTIGPEIIRVLPEYSGFPTTYPASLGWLLAKIANKQNYFSSMAYYPQGASSAIEAEGTTYDIGRRLYNVWQTNEGVSANPIRFIPQIGYTCFGDNTWMRREIDNFNPVESAQIRDVMNHIRHWIFEIGIALAYRLNNAQAEQIFFGMLQPKLVQMKKAGVLNDYKIILSPNVKTTNSIKRRTKVGSVRLEIFDIIEHVDVGLYMYPVDSGLV